MFSAVKVTVCPSLRVTTISFGLIPSWLSASLHTFLTVASVSAGLWVFVIVVIVPSVVLPVNSYPVGTLVSVQVYLISFPSLYFGKFLTVSVQLFSAVKVTVCPSLRVTTSSSGLTPSWLSASLHTFLTVASVSSGLWVFVIVVIVPSVVLSVNSYPVGTEFSVQVYLISCPSLYFGKCSTVSVQWFVSFNTTVFPVFKVMIISSGLIPSWLSASFHTFLTVASVSSGLWVFVTDTTSWFV